ncbi:phoH-like protein [Ditylenchus destructor]|nr:phoH-like protein [Ditylenchus destructor]
MDHARARFAARPGRTGADSPGESAGENAMDAGIAAASDPGSERNGQADDRAPAGAGFDQALAVHLLGARLHAGHAVSLVQATFQLQRDALAVVLDHDGEIAVLRRAADHAMRRARVLDDVAHRLAQDAGGLDVGAGGEGVLDVLGGGFPLGQDVGLGQTRHHLGAPVAQGVQQHDRLAGQAAHRQPHFFQRFARQGGDAVRFAGVDDGQQLGAQVVVQVGGDALALALGDLLQLGFGHLVEVALQLGDAFLQAQLALQHGQLRLRQRARELPHPMQSQADQRQRRQDAGQAAARQRPGGDHGQRAQADQHAADDEVGAGIALLQRGQEHVLPQMPDMPGHRDQQLRAQPPERETGDACGRKTAAAARSGRAPPAPAARGADGDRADAAGASGNGRRTTAARARARRRPPPARASAAPGRPSAPSPASAQQPADPSAPAPTEPVAELRGQQRPAAHWARIAGAGDLRQAGRRDQREQRGQADGQRAGGAAHGRLRGRGHGDACRAVRTRLPLVRPLLFYGPLHGGRLCSDDRRAAHRRATIAPSTPLNTEPARFEPAPRFHPCRQPPPVPSVRPLDEHLRQIEAALSVRITHRAEHFNIEGERAAAQRTLLLLEAMYARADRAIPAESLRLAIVEAANDVAAPMRTGGAPGDVDAEGHVVLRTRRADLAGRTPNQHEYLRRILSHDINFGIGPAGTGKTFLAVPARSKRWNARRCSVSSCRVRRSRQASVWASCPAT